MRSTRSSDYEGCPPFFRASHAVHSPRHSLFFSRALTERQVEKARERPATQDLVSISRVLAGEESLERLQASPPASFWVKLLIEPGGAFVRRFFASQSERATSWTMVHMRLAFATSVFHPQESWTMASKHACYSRVLSPVVSKAVP